MCECMSFPQRSNKVLLTYLPVIGLYRENAIAIQNESGDSNGGNV